ncbi:MAG TPA: DUF1428 domain-containing protein [Planctomycetota bacterium]|jgi:uncharacterized protein YbaA (DUF1428 family)|nr:DUF1428 domain-containing protein [Planctomycetota bacterium]
MAKYVDGFVIPVPKKNAAAYKRMATWGRKMWMKYGALQYFECVGDDLKVQPGCGLGFSKGARLKPNDSVVFAFIVYKSKAHRDAVNKKVFADPSMKQMPPSMPFDIKRMMYGGFKVFIEG